MSDTLILIVEDNPKNLKLFRDVLQFNGFETIEADSAETGIELAKQRMPALILMDIQLPKMAGDEAMKVLKADDMTRHIPIVAVTSFAMKGDRERLLAEGFNGYLAKPVNIKELPQIVQHQLEEKT
jgi:two-component system cell cycle response regulator DivK